MASAKDKKKEVETLAASLSWADFESIQKFDIELSNGLKLQVDTLTAAKVLQISKVVGGTLVEIFNETSEDMPMTELVQVALDKLDHETLEALAEAIFDERRVANLPASVLMDLVEQYADKVGIQEVFSAGRKIAALVSKQ